jgi:hypothetical protein
MGFSVKIAPGVRVRASSRGVRTSIGPRAARVHVGGGRSGFSTGAGSVGFYTSLGGGSGRRRSTSVSSYQRQAAAGQRAADKVAQARQLSATFNALLNVHREQFPAAVAPVAPFPPPPDEGAVRARHEKAALTGIGLFRLADRKAAKAQAAWTADQELRSLHEQSELQRQAQQRALDQMWAALNANEPEIVMATLTEAFADNEAAAAPVGVDGAEVTLVVLAPDESIVPERMPGTTAAGNLTLRKLPKGERASFYTLAVLGHVVVTLRETFAIAPGVEAATVVTVREAGLDAYGKPRFECLLAGRWLRTALDGVVWQQANAATVAEDTAAELLINLRAGKELRPLELKSHPEVAAILALVEPDNLLD